jgi:hypothetical protein
VGRQKKTPESLARQRGENKRRQGGRKRRHLSRLLGGGEEGRGGKIRHLSPLLGSVGKERSGKVSCTSCLMHKTRSCAHTLHKDRVSGVRDVAEKVRWNKFFKGWTAFNEIWRGTVLLNSRAFFSFFPCNHFINKQIIIFFFRRSKRQRNFSLFYFASQES